MLIYDLPITRTRRRRAFTLLEVLLASIISVLLLSALYVAVDLQLRHAQIARDVVEESTLARHLLARITSDISQSIGPALPAPPSNSGASAGSAATPSSSSANSSATASTGTTGAATSSSSPAASATAANAGSGVVFNVGVQGDATHLVLSISRLPWELTDMVGDPNGPTVVSDLRRITYWLAGTGDAPLGLARAEIKQATSDDALNVLSNLPEDLMHIMAAEVKSLEFSYFDGSTWQDSWDGTAAGADGSTPIGPPVAIAITLGISPSEAKSVKMYRQVVVIPTANGLPPANTGQGG